MRIDKRTITMLDIWLLSLSTSLNVNSGDEDNIMTSIGYICWNIWKMQCKVFWLRALHLIPRRPYLVLIVQYRRASGSSIQVYAISEIPALTFGNVIGHWSLGLQIGSGSLNQVSIVEDEPLYLGQPTPSSLIGILDKDGLPCPPNHST
ncbi:hypothetical protein GBA52_016315 [Prunus armeniaca]|nr:hypothetical protein GBA52_016315 [Prunus armeniaca]